MCSALDSIALAFSNMTGGHFFRVTRMALPFGGPIDDLGTYWDLSMLDPHAGTNGMYDFDIYIFSASTDNTANCPYPFR
jgi:hypothetical protein